MSKHREGGLFLQRLGFIFIDNFGAFDPPSGPMSVCIAFLEEQNPQSSISILCPPMPCRSEWLIIQPHKFVPSLLKYRSAFVFQYEKLWVFFFCALHKARALRL